MNWKKNIAKLGKFILHVLHLCYKILLIFSQLLLVFNMFFHFDVSISHNYEWNLKVKSEISTLILSKNIGQNDHSYPNRERYHTP